MLTSTTDETVSGHTGGEDDAALFARFARHLSVVYSHLSVADALKDSAAELRKVHETMMSQYVHTKLSEGCASMWRCRRFTTTFQREIWMSREGEENRLARLVLPQAFKGACWD